MLHIITVVLLSRITKLIINNIVLLRGDTISCLVGMTNSHDFIVNGAGRERERDTAKRDVIAKTNYSQGLNVCATDAFCEEVTVTCND